MGISCFQLNIFAMTSQKSKIEKQMMSINDERDIVTAQLGKAYKKEDWYKDANVKLLQSQDDRLDQELGQLETQLKAIQNNLESLEKQKENNIKNGVAKLA